MRPSTADQERSILYNQDPGALFYDEKPIDPEDVDEMVDEVADAEVDTFLVNVNMWRTNYPSDVWETWWDGWQQWAAENPPIRSERITDQQHWHHPRHPTRHRMIEQMERLASQGCDYLERSLARCRARDVTPGVSIRMNDQHDRDHPGSHYFSDFYRNNPQLQLDTGRDSGLAGLNYEHEAVRDHFIALIEEVTGDYDPDVLELDFLRHTPFFDDEDASTHTPIMTGFVERVNELCEPESIRVIPRVPATPATATELGLDIEAWADHGLVDGLIVGPSSCFVDWQIPVGAFRRSVGEHPLYVSLDKWADAPRDFPRRLIFSDEELLRGVGGAYATPEVDGLYLFNFFGPRVEEIDPEEPLFSELPTLKSDATLRGTDKTYVTTAGATHRTVSPTQVPFTANPEQPRAVSMSVMEEPPETTFEVTALIDREVPASSLWLQVNHEPIGGADAVEEYVRPGYRTHPEESGTAAVFTVPAEPMAATNRFVFRNRHSEPLTVYGVEVHANSP